MELMDSEPVATRSQPVEGWRAWNLSDGPTGPVLRPVGSGVDGWEPRRALEARCGAPSFLSFGRGAHRAPALHCRCGIYAASSPESFERSRPAWPPPPVIGTVSLWGTVIEHERGWRARWAYPSRLALVCVTCAWVEPGPGTPAVVHTFAGRYYLFCAEHRGGIALPDGRTTVPHDVEPKDVQSRLLDAYAVDLLPLGSLDDLFRRPPSPEPPAYMPSIRTIPVIRSL